MPDSAGAQYLISPEAIELEDFQNLLSHSHRLELSDSAHERIKRCSDFLEAKLSEGGPPIYGVTTGFGALCRVRISKEEANTLQVNLVRSHAAGVGPAIDIELVRKMLLLKIRNMSFGHSGVQMSTVQRLLDHLKEGLIPEVPEQGSLGASGDLCPLAHLSLPLIGEGYLYHAGKRHEAKALLKEKGWEPIDLRAKEGLALLNGTQFMMAYAIECQLQAEKLLNLAELIAAMSVDARGALMVPFEERTHKLRNQLGQLRSAEMVREWLDGSPMANTGDQVQDPYSFRCTPQVHGASRDSLAHTRSIFTRELNAVTDNPLLFPEDGDALSGGNFHGQPLALALDFLAIATAEIANLAERRAYRLLAGENGLPDFLNRNNSGMHSGFMIAQYTAASLVSQNKQLCTPASVDSISSSQEQEDHVSMGANAATKALRICQNTEQVLAIAFMIAAQALNLRRPNRSSDRIEEIMTAYRKVVPMLDGDRTMAPDIAATADFLRKLEV